jgi:hypothetical protein
VLSRSLSVLGDGRLPYGGRRRFIRQFHDDVADTVAIAYRDASSVADVPHADRLGQRVTAAAPVRSSLIAKGMIYSPAHGDTAFTVPLFDGFLKRAIPAPQL